MARPDGLELLRGKRPRKNRGGAFAALFTNADQVGVGNFNAHSLVFAALGKVFFDEDGFAGVGDQGADGRKMDITRAVVRLHTFPDERRVTQHSGPSVATPARSVNGTIV